MIHISIFPDLKRKGDDACWAAGAAKPSRYASAGRSIIPLLLKMMAAEMQER